LASVFLTNAPYSLTERYGKLASIGATLPSLGLVTLGSALRMAGHRVRIVDASARGWGGGQVIDEIKKFQPDVIGLTAVTPSIAKTANLASKIKEVVSSVPIVIGGPHFTAVPQKTLIDNRAFDYGVVGEGETTIVELVDVLAQGNVPSQVPGVVYRENGAIRFAPPRDPIIDLDSLPFPAWDLLDGFPSQYRPALFKYKRLPATHVVSARGCPNNCVFCDTSVFGRRVRFHSTEYVLEMVQHLIKRFNVREIIFEDDQFLLKKGRVAKICERFLKAKWRISWSCSGRVNSVDDFELLKLMKRSGCWQINFGIESGNQQILDHAKKKITTDQVENAVRLTQKAGILSKGYFIFGLPTETEKTMEDTIRFAKKLPLNDVSVFMLTPFPGSPVYEVADKYGSLEQNFENMNILNAVFIPNGLTKEHLLSYQRRFMREFYLRPRIIGNYLGRLISNPSNILSMFKGSFGFLEHVFRPNFLT